MKLCHSRVRWLLIATLVASLPAGSASAQCQYNPLASGVSETTTTTPWEYLPITQTEYYWTAVGIRGASGEDWDLSAYADPDASPSCVTTLLSSSAEGAGVVDFVVADFNTGGAPLNLYYMGAHQFSGTSPATVEWDDGDDILEVNGELITRSTDGTDVLEVWDLFVEAGVDYQVRFQTAGSADLKLFLFERPASAPYWMSRSQGFGGFSGDFFFTQPTTGWHAVVVVNDNGGTGTYDLGVSECTNRTVLTSGDYEVSFEWQRYFEFNQINDYWTAIGCRRIPGDVDLSLYSQPGGGGSPICLADSLAGTMKSDSGLVLLVGDFNSGGIPTGTFYARVQRDEPGAGGYVQWDSGPDQFHVDALPIYRTVDATNVLEVWDIYLESSNSYSVNFNTIGDAWTRMYLFNRDQFKDWQDAGDAYFTTDGTGYFTPTVDGWYGLVVANLDGGSGEYSLSLTTCQNYGFLSDDYGPIETWGPSENLGFVQEQPYWAAVGVRGPGTSDWDLELYEYESGGVSPICQSNLLASSDQPIDPPVVDFVVGDFNHNPSPRAYYPRTVQFSGSDNAYVEWDGGDDLILVNDTPAHGYTGAGEILRTWDVYLEGGQDYHIYFDRSGEADTKLFLFNSEGGVYWGSRASATLVTESSTTIAVVADDFYGLVVVNDNGLDGNYSLGVYTAGVPVGSVSPPSATAMRSVIPNPTRGATTVHFDLKKATGVSFDVLDVAGRVVSRIPRQDYEAGAWSTSWNGNSTQGSRLPAGIYFVRMKLDDQIVSRKKIVLLH